MPEKQQARRSCAVFAFYAGVMLWLLLGREQRGTELDYWEAVLRSVNLEPFQTIRGYWSHLARYEYYQEYFGADYGFHAWQAIRNLGGNVILFVPLGYFLPRLWPALRKWWRTWLAAVLVVTAVELTQVLTLRGACDVDDLILNLLGTALGYGLFCIISRKQ